MTIQANGNLIGNANDGRIEASDEEALQNGVADEQKGGA
jgi:hypothetical protein